MKKVILAILVSALSFNAMADGVLTVNNNVLGSCITAVGLTSEWGTPLWSASMVGPDGVPLTGVQEPFISNSNYQVQIWYSNPDPNNSALCGTDQADNTPVYSCMGLAAGDIIDIGSGAGGGYALTVTVNNGQVCPKISD